MEREANKTETQAHICADTVPAVEIRRNDDGSIDEIIAAGCCLHVEQLSANSWYFGIDAADGSYWQFWLGAKNMRSAVEIRHTETSTGETK